MNTGGNQTNLKAFQPPWQGSQAVCCALLGTTAATQLVHTVVCGGALRIITTTFLCHICDIFETLFLLPRTGKTSNEYWGKPDQFESFPATLARQPSSMQCFAWHYCCYIASTYSGVCGGALRIVTPTFLSLASMESHQLL